MSELADRMNLIKSELALALTERVVTRDLLDFSQRAADELESGIYTIMSNGERGYQNLNGRKAMDGTHPILLVGQFKLNETAAETPALIEDAEFAMVEEIKGFVRALPATLCRLHMLGFRQSMQVDAPYGWVSIDMEFSK
jgi:hypothetical protein